MRASAAAFNLKRQRSFHQQRRLTTTTQITNPTRAIPRATAIIMSFPKAGRVAGEHLKALRR